MNISDISLRNVAEDDLPLLYKWENDEEGYYCFYDDFYVHAADCG